MGVKSVHFGDKGLDKLVEGINVVGNAVRVRLRMKDSFVFPQLRLSRRMHCMRWNVASGEPALMMILGMLDGQVTLGPMGRNVVLSRDSKSSPQIVNDGVTIARDIDLADPEVNIGVRLIQEVAKKSGKAGHDYTKRVSTSHARLLCEVNCFSCSEGVC
jgi:hypothetical protein